MWMKGPRRRVPTPGTNAKRAFFGALDAQSGVVHTTDHARKLAVHFVAFLKQLVAAYPHGPLYLALDNVQMHDAKVIRRLERRCVDGSFACWSAAATRAIHIQRA